ncbi:MAG: hypothetical protein ACO3EF_09650 [Vulcanococcus sp.]
MVQPLPSSIGFGLGLLIAATPSALGQAYVPFPSQESLRQVQLAALACARENTAASCEQARQLADPLLDHPRLPTGCKDHLWAIRQRAQPATVNSFSRREGLTQPAQLLLLACRSGEKPPEPATPPAGSGGGGLKFGGGA